MSRNQRSRVHDVLRERRIRLRRKASGLDPVGVAIPPAGFTWKTCQGCGAVVANDLDRALCVPCWFASLLGPIPRLA